jgi:acetyl-CoA carboxylase carboxyl transferase subunit beta
VAGADLLIGVPGARVSFSGTRTRPAGADQGSPEYLADSKWAHGFVDVLSPVDGLRGQVAAAVRLLSPRSRGGTGYRAPVPSWPAGPSTSIGDGTSTGESGVQAGPAADAWGHVRAARSGGRARASQWLAGYFERPLEIRGDRCGGVDGGLRCGFGSHQGRTIAYVAQTGNPTTPAGFRTATRLLRLADRLGLPVLTLIDTPGAAATPGDEAAGAGPAIAELFMAVAASQVPVTSVVIGEGVSGGALALASPDDLWIARDGYLAVTAPEFAASILKLGRDDVPRLTGWLRLTPAELVSRGLARGVIGPGRT